MLTPKQIEEIQSHLEKAQNPLFYYDNDTDGLSSFLIFRRYLGRGKGVAVRSYPGLNSTYVHKAEELKADYIFILDKPVVTKDFFEEIDMLQIPIVWIDHHDLEQEDLSAFSNLYVYNPAKNAGKDKSSEPTSYMCYMITKRKEDLWLAMAGCVADHYLPEFSKEFAEKYPDLWTKNIKKPFDAYYKSEIGKIAQAFNYGLKDSTSNIVEMQNFLISCKGPEEVFSEMAGNQAFRRRYKEVKKKFDALVKNAQNRVHGKIVFFEYSGDISMSSDVSNYLSYIYPDKYVIVVYMKGSISNLSMRGKNVKAIFNKLVSRFDGASGGGHDDAVGARIKTEDVQKFKEEMEVEIDGRN